MLGLSLISRRIPPGPQAVRPPCLFHAEPTKRLSHVSGCAGRRRNQSSIVFFWFEQRLDRGQPRGRQARSIKFRVANDSCPSRPRRKQRRFCRQTSGQTTCRPPKEARHALDPEPSLSIQISSPLSASTQTSSPLGWWYTAFRSCRQEYTGERLHGIIFQTSDPFREA